MKYFADLTFGQRFALTVAIVLAILFALALIGLLSGGWENADYDAAEDALPSGNLMACNCRKG